MSDAVLTPLGSARTPVGVEARRERRLDLILLAIAAAARLPFIWRGFGGHPDEWMVVRSGLDLWRRGVYFPSRGPGYPLSEVVMGGLAWLGGPPLCAAASLAVSLVAIALLRKLAPFYGVRNSFWMVLAFSFEPWFWSSGTHDLDYVWGTCALIAALYCLERRELRGCGLLCAAGFAFRPSSLLWIFPVFTRVVWTERDWRGVARFALWAAVPALVPALMIASKSALVMGPGGWQVAELTRASHAPVAALLLAVYRFVELIGHVPALLLFLAACWLSRARLAALFRSGESWVWNFVLIFLFLFAEFISQSEKPELMLPALPGLFMILGRCISDNWWKALTVAFVFNAFISFGLGHALPAGGLRLDLAYPTLRPGPLLLYAQRAKAQNAFVAQVGAELSQPSRIVRADPTDDRLDPYYLASRLVRAPQSQARIACPLAPALVAYPEGKPPEIVSRPSTWVLRRGYQPALVCCETGSALVLPSTPAAFDDRLREAAARFCRSRAPALPPASPASR